MNVDYSIKLQQKLIHIPFGEYEFVNYSGEDNDAILSSSNICLKSNIQSKGQIENIPIYTGIELSFYRCLGTKISARHEARETVIELNYCHKGSVKWDMNNGSVVYLRSGDLSVHTMSLCSNSELTFPLKYYDGVSITMDLNKINIALPEILEDAGIRGQDLYEKFCLLSRSTIIHNNKKIEDIFSAIYKAPCDAKTAYYKLKVQELILFLSSLDISEEKIVNPYHSQQIKLINEICTFLTQNIDQHITIDELSKKFFINKSALKELFKVVYGAPIATYMKEYRMKRAMELLRTTNDHISEIAQAVGYQSQSKFTVAFKDITKILPSEYRKLSM